MINYFKILAYAFHVLVELNAEILAAFACEQLFVLALPVVQRFVSLALDARILRRYVSEPDGLDLRNTRYATRPLMAVEDDGVAAGFGKFLVCELVEAFEPGGRGLSPLRSQPRIISALSG